MKYIPVPHSAVFAPGSLAKYKYVVMFAQYQGKWLFCRHKKRSTIGTPGERLMGGTAPERIGERMEEVYE